MPKSISERVTQTFGKDDTVHAEKLQDIALSSMGQLSDSVTRTIGLVFLLGALFELLVNSTNVKSLTLGPVSFSNSSLLQQFLPALIAYLLYDAYHLVNRWRHQTSIYNAITQKFQPALADSELMAQVLPVIRGPWSFGLRLTGENEQPSDRFSRHVNEIIGTLAIVVLPIAFEFQAYATLMHKYGARNILVWVSMITAVFFIAIWQIKMRLDFVVWGRRRDEPRRR